MTNIILKGVNNQQYIGWKTSLGEKRNMLVVGSVSSREEQNEIRLVAELAIIGQRFRYLAHQSNKKNRRRPEK